VPNSTWTETGSSISLVPVTSPIDPGSSVENVNYVTNADKIALMAQYASELAMKTSLDSLATTWVVPSTTYNSAVAMINTTITSYSGAPSNWATIWPDGTNSGPWTGVQTSLSSDWAAIATARTALQASISAAQAGAAQAAAIASAVAQALASAPVAVASLPTLPSTTYPSGRIVWNQADGQLYLSTGIAWSVMTPAGTNIAAHSITAGQIEAGSITAAQLAVAALDVGGTGSAPTEVVVLDASNGWVAEIGKMSGSGPWGGQYGGWFKNLGIGGVSPNSPNLWFDSLGNLTGPNGVAVDFSGNLNLKNCISVQGTTVNPTISTSGFADLPELGSTSIPMAVTNRGNPCFIGANLSFYGATGAGSTGPVTSIGTYFSSTTSSTIGPPNVSISISGDGSGAGASVSWQGQWTGSSVVFTPTMYLYGGSGYTHATATVVITNGSGSYYNGTTTYTCGVTVATPMSGIPIQVQLLMDGSVLYGPVATATDASGYATINFLSLQFPISGSHAFAVQAQNLNSTYYVANTHRGFQLVELG